MHSESVSSDLRAVPTMPLLLIHRTQNASRLTSLDCFSLRKGGPK